MEHHTTLNAELNNSCEKSKLTSWTKHVNHRGTVYTIRFSEKAAMFDPTAQEFLSTSDPIIYKPKSQFHINRDYSRMRKFNNNFVQPNSFENDISFGTSLGSNIHHSATVSYSCNQNNSQPITDAVNESSSFRVTEYHQSMADSNNSQLPSIEKDVLTAEILEFPPVQFECLEPQHCVQPLVELQSTATISPPVELHYASCELLPAVEEPAEMCFTPIQRNITILPNTSELSPTCHFENKLNFDSTIPNFSKTVNQAPEGFIAKYLSSSDILCDICSATVPSDTNMLFCESCSLHVCGNCLISCSYDHSLNCTDVLRYMRSDEKHLQYVPDSNNSSTISDDAQLSTDMDSVVPTWQPGFSFDSQFLDSLGQRLSATIKDTYRKSLLGISRDHDPGGFKD